MSDQLTMVLTSRFCDGSGRTTTHVGDKDALGAAFRQVIPSLTTVRQGYTLEVTFYPSPS